MSSEDFEIKILKPFLEKMPDNYYYDFKIVLCDGASYFLRDQENQLFQSFMISKAQNLFYESKV